MAFAIQLKAEIQQNYDYAEQKSDGIMKAYIPNFLYKPPFGYPLNKNIDLIKKLSHNGYIFSIKTAIKDRIASTNWNIKLKEEFLTDDTGNVVDTSKYEKERKNIIKWFNNPNKNKESFEQLLRKIVDSILEVDAGIFVKVFNRAGVFKELFCYDGGTFLKNPDIHGYMGNRSDFVWPSDAYLTQETLATAYSEGFQNNEQVRQLYEQVYRTNAAYFQYGWTASSMPVPFGLREIVYIMRHPRSDTIYGISPVEVLSDVILTLVYGSNYNLDFYVNNNMPDGIIQLIDAQEPQIRMFRQRFEAEFKYKDAYNNYRRKFHSYPIVNKEAKFTQFQLSSEQMQIIEQQKWFTKIVWSCFGITPSELGFTEDSNKATEVVQSNIGKKKLINPLLKLLEYHINTEVMIEFGSQFFEFKFDDYDLEEDIKRHTLYKMQIDMGLKTSEMVAEEEGIDVGRLKKEKEEAMQRQIEFYSNQDSDKQDDSNKQDDSDKFKKGQDSASKEEMDLKSFFLKKEVPDAEKVLKDYFDKVEDQLITVIEGLSKNRLAEIKGLPEDILGIVSKSFAVEQFTPLITKKIKESFLDGLEEAGRQLNRNFMPNQKAIDFLSDYTFKNIKGMSEETADKLRKEISQGIINKENVTEMKSRIQKIFKVADNRISMIVRTETNRALSQGRLEGAMQSGLKLVKKWSSHIDERTSPICKALNGQIIPLDQKFKYKGEEFDTTPAHVNCRSRVIYIQEDET